MLLFPVLVVVTHSDHFQIINNNTSRWPKFKAQNTIRLRVIKLTSFLCTFFVCIYMTSQTDGKVVVMNPDDNLTHQKYSDFVWTIV